MVNNIRDFCSTCPIAMKRQPIDSSCSPHVLPFHPLLAANCKRDNQILLSVHMYALSTNNWVYEAGQQRVSSGRLMHFKGREEETSTVYSINLLLGVAVSFRVY